jgi:beta-glucosidase
MLNFKKTILLGGVLVLSSPCGVLAAELLPYQDPARSTEDRVSDLLTRLHLEEKVELVSGNGFKTKPNARLGIPEIVMTDGPLGPNRKGKATNYSAMINLAATFDTTLMYEVARNIGEETRILGCHMLLAPMINIARVPHGGRTFECFSEDPYLTSRLTVAYVKGVQRERIITCTKVLAANNQEWNRFDVDARMDERTLREVYLPAFKAAVEEADTWSIMAAYNQALGHYCCENKYLLNDILKEEWGFTGMTVSDWGGVRSTVKAARAGLDLEMPSAKHYGEKLLKAVRGGQIEEATVDDKVRRILRVMFKAGLFDKSVADDDGGRCDTPQRRALALKVARKSIVLLTNKSCFLPVDEEGIQSIAVIGPNGDAARMYGAGSGSLPGHYGISPLQGIRSHVGNRITVRFERGVPERRLVLPIAGPESYRLPDGKPGIRAEYFNNRDQEGEPVLTRVEKSIDFDWGFGAGHPEGGTGSPEPGVVNLEKWSARWSGKLVSPGCGWYEIGLQADNGIRLYLDGKKVLDSWIDSRPGQFKVARYEFEAGRQYDLRIDFYENVGSCRCHLGIASYQPDALLEDAVTLAGESDIVVLCVGLDEEMEGEAIDREELSLPQEQLELIDAIVRANDRTIVVLNNGTPILVETWVDRVPAIVEAFYPGQEGGRALAEILFGDVSPSGRLPLTFPKRWEDCPAYGTYPGRKDVAYYSEGIFVGYRHFDKENIAPRFPFGHGLSYASFDYSGLKVSPRQVEESDVITVKAKITNTGSMAADEVVQLYLRDVQATVEREVKAFKGSVRVHLAPGESGEVSFKLNKDDLSFFDVSRRQWVAEPGTFEVLVGGSSRDIRLKGEFELN